MKNYKICVYAICKNESKFIQRWYESVKDADYICVLDTGSTDDSLDKLNKLGITVKQKIIKPWRFDVARNESLKLIPDDADICICLDLDEVLIGNWKEILLNSWNEKTTRIMYTYNWSLDDKNKPIVSFYTNKIHKNNYYTWTHPVHEILKINDGFSEVETLCDKLIINHYPDSSKSRSSYLPLLELSVKESPNDDRNMHYLGREYMFYGKYHEAIDTLIKHLDMQNALWKDERCASMRFIGRCYKYLNRFKESEMWYKLSIKEAPYLRDGYMELALLYYEKKMYSKMNYYVHKALKIVNNKKSYINETFTYDETAYDLLSIGNYYLGKYKSSLKYVNMAINIKCNDRLLNNRELILNKIKTG